MKVLRKISILSTKGIPTIGVGYNLRNSDVLNLVLDVICCNQTGHFNNGI